MDDDATEVNADQSYDAEPNLQTETFSEELSKLRGEFENRLIAANLRTEAVRGGMIDLDGLKLIDAAGLVLDENDKIVGGRKLMTELRRSKPWLFHAVSSSSAAVAPASQPVRQKLAVDMTEEEYVAARTALTKYRF